MYNLNANLRRKDAIPLFSNSALAILGGLILLALVWLAALTVVIRRAEVARRRVGAIVDGQPDIFKVVGKALDDIDGLSLQQDRLGAASQQHRALLSESLRFIGLVRFDAFAEVGGRLSFSVALLNEGADGLVISTINGRSDSRVYAKPIVDGQSEFPLSEEEETAIRKAFEGVST